MAGSKQTKIFDTDRRIKLGIWGLGRGYHFFKACEALNFDVVAGCDYLGHLQKRFSDMYPDALVTADAEEFLKDDFDAVLLATFFPNHGEDAIRCLQAGKHVLSEVTSFITMAQGVRLVEEVERSGRVYNLAENYPFSKGNMYLARKYREGLFGEFQYAEFEYTHECRQLCYTYLDGSPVQPGHTVHNWRSWFNFHYYNTHSLGPMMYITDTRPTRVVSLPGTTRLPGYLPAEPADGNGLVSPSLITMSNGAVVRNLMGATTCNATHHRICGTLGSAEYERDGLFLRLGAEGHGTSLAINPEWPDRLGELAQSMGHGGGDFWVLYHFAREILFNEPAFFNVYRAADCTIPGILARRSSLENGQPYDVPDFRDPNQRDAWRHDDAMQIPYDVKKGCFPKNADKKITGSFSATMSKVIPHATKNRALIDWMNLFDDIRDAEGKQTVKKLAEDYFSRLPEMKKAFAQAHKLIRAYPRSDGAKVLSEMLEVGSSTTITGKGFQNKVSNFIDPQAKR